jgi:xanthine dehydrogenase YagS FAD-binding subunit
MCVALAALDATVHSRTGGGARCVSDSIGCQEHAAALYNLEPNEIVTAVELPAPGFAVIHRLKIRDLSYAFALVSIATGLSWKETRS